MRPVSLMVRLAVASTLALPRALPGQAPSQARQQSLSEAGTFLMAWIESESGGSDQSVYLKNISKDREITITWWEIYDCNNLAGKGCGRHDGGPVLKPGKTARLVTVRRRESRGGYSYKYRFNAEWTPDPTATAAPQPADSVSPVVADP